MSLRKSWDASSGKDATGRPWTKPKVETTKAPGEKVSPKPAPPPPKKGD